MEFDRTRRAKRQVNLTPLIDVVFLLIVFFMLSTSFVMSESLELVLPSVAQREEAKSKPKEDVMRLLVQPDGAVVYNDEYFSLNEMDTMLNIVLSQHPEQGILILSTDGTNVQQIIAVMDMINLAGGKRVRIDHFGKSDIGYDVKMDGMNF